jgi:hypothetical protein
MGAMTVKLFSARNFLRHVRFSTLAPFVQNHAIWPHVRASVDVPSSPSAGEDVELSEVLSDKFSKAVSDAVEALQVQLTTGYFDTPEQHLQKKAVEQDLLQWMDDLRRAHAMSGELGVAQLRNACHADAGDVEGRRGGANRTGKVGGSVEALLAALQNRNGQEAALWMLGERPHTFRDAELQLAFVTRAEGRYWKRHCIPRQLPMTPEAGLAADRLDRFGRAVCQLYKKSGAGQGVHLEWTRHGVADCDGAAANGTADTNTASVQLTVYVEGPVTAISHFEKQHFMRGNARLALESALLYHPTTGEVETIVKGGAKNHAALLSLFAEHLVGQKLEPQQLHAAPLRLDTLLSGTEPVEDWSHRGVRSVRLRRARLISRGSADVSFSVEASNDPAAPDALAVARTGLRGGAHLEQAYHLDAATIVVYLNEYVGQRAAQFSFQVRACGRSTIKHLPLRHQTTASHVLRALQLIEYGEQRGLGRHTGEPANMIESSRAA